MTQRKLIYSKKVYFIDGGGTEVEEFGVEPIPSEIDLVENDNLLTLILKHKIYPPVVFSLLRNTKPEINSLYSYIIENVKQPNELAGETFLETYKQAAIEYFNKKKYEDKFEKQYMLLKRCYFEDQRDHLFSRNLQDEVPDEVHIKRDFIGKLCQVIISDYYPDILPDPKNPPRHYGFKPLHRLFSELKIKF